MQGIKDGLGTYGYVPLKNPGSMGVEALGDWQQLPSDVSASPRNQARAMTLAMLC